MNVNIGGIESLPRAGGTQTNGARVGGQMGRKAGAERKGKRRESEAPGNGFHGYGCLGNRDTYPFLCSGVESE